MKLRRLRCLLPRLGYCHWLLIIALLVNLIVIYFLAFAQYKLDSEDSDKDDLHGHGSNKRSFSASENQPINGLGNISSHSTSRNWQTSITFVIREFEEFENDVSKVVDSLLSSLPICQIAVVTDDFPYPPISLPKIDNLQLIRLQLQPQESAVKMRVENLIRTRYIAIVPDAVTLEHPSEVLHAVDFLEQQQAQIKDIKMVAMPIDTSSTVHCMGLDANLKQWTLQYFLQHEYCDALMGEFIIIMHHQDFFNLSDPFARPLNTAFFIQTAVRKWKAVVYTSKKLAFKKDRMLYEEAHIHWKYKTVQHARVKALYERFGVKLVQQADGHEEWYGCNKDSDRCFGTVISDMPEFIQRGKWTPPCCLKALRITARHVFRVLESQGVRYWLEGGSLLGAARNGDIIPWDYDIDIGIYKDDITKSYHLSNCMAGAYADEDEFVWEKASEGDFFRVQYSQSNHLHVDIFPFYSRNGTMTKSTWFKTHRQDMEFPEHFLKPLTKIKFAGLDVLAPNNVREFLELKFGKGVIENPKYPDWSDV